MPEDGAFSPAMAHQGDDGRVLTPRFWSLRIAAIALATLSVFSTVEARAAAQAALVMNAVTGEVLYSSNPDVTTSPASLAKLMTLYLTFEALESGRLKLNQQLTISRRASIQPASKLYLQAGQTIAVEEAIRGLVTKSANDVAMVLSEAIGGTEEQFAAKMTAKAKQLGMNSTNFRNSSGLFHSEQYTTARDVAKLGMALMRDYPRQYPYFSTPSFTYKGTTHTNHNGLLGRYAGVDGLKTGYIDASGFNLAASVVRGNTRLVGVVMGGKTAAARDREMTGLFDMAFNRIATLDYTKQPKQPAAAPLAMTKPPAAAAPTPTRPAVAAAPTVPKPTGAPEPTGWAIQAGAYKIYDDAAKRLAQVAPVVVTSLKNPAPMVLPDAKGEMHRVRIGQLTLTEARNACRQLEQKGMGCVTISPAAQANDLALVTPKGAVAAAGQAGFGDTLNEIARMLRARETAPAK